MFVDRYHPLRKLFTELVARRLYGDAGVRGPSIAEYVSTLLTSFAHAENLYLLESNPLLAGRSFDREREVRKHVGDFTLFLTGLFPEYVASLPPVGRVHRLFAGG